MRTSVSSLVGATSLKKRAAGLLFLSALLASCRTGGEIQPIVIDLTSSKTPTKSPSPSSTPTPPPPPATPTPTPAAAATAGTPPPAPVAAPAPAAAALAPRSAERVVDEQLEAYNRRDLETFLASYARNAQLFEGPGAPRERGIDQIRKRYARQFAESPLLHATISQRITEGPFVVDHERVTGLAGGDSLSVVVVYRVDEGKITKVWFLR